MYFNDLSIAWGRDGGKALKGGIKGDEWEGIKGDVGEWWIRERCWALKGGKRRERGFEGGR